MELWFNIFNENLPSFAEQACERAGVAVQKSFDVTMENSRKTQRSLCGALSTLGCAALGD
jgi:hypothetical protein